jgi:hypothetical protein
MNRSNRDGFCLRRRSPESSVFGEFCLWGRYFSWDVYKRGFCMKEKGIFPTSLHPGLWLHTCTCNSTRREEPWPWGIRNNGCAKCNHKLQGFQICWGMPQVPLEMTSTDWYNYHVPPPLNEKSCMYSMYETLQIVNYILLLCTWRCAHTDTKLLRVLEPCDICADD